MQSQAADLNLLQEKIAISSDASQMEIELQSLLIQNEREAHEAEDIFEIVKAVKEKIASLEREIQMVCLRECSSFVIHTQIFGCFTGKRRGREIDHIFSSRRSGEILAVKD